MFRWFKSLLPLWPLSPPTTETPYSILMERGKTYFEMSSICLENSKTHVKMACYNLASEDLAKAREFESLAVDIFEKAVKLRFLEESEIEPPKALSEFASYRTT